MRKRLIASEAAIARQRKSIEALRKRVADQGKRLSESRRAAARAKKPPEPGPATPTPPGPAPSTGYLDSRFGRWYQKQ
jgi:hypothetical protein